MPVAGDMGKLALDPVAVEAEFVQRRGSGHPAASRQDTGRR
jgi:hypothetical protein